MTFDTPLVRWLDAFTCWRRLQESLRQLLLRLAVDHPYHSLYHLFALANGNRDRHGRRLEKGHVR